MLLGGTKPSKEDPCLPITEGEGIREPVWGSQSCESQHMETGLEHRIMSGTRYLLLDGELGITVWCTPGMGKEPITMPAIGIV